MRLCRFYRLIFAVIPFYFFKDWLLRHHLEICPFCQQETASDEEINQLFKQELAQMDLIISFWPKIKLYLPQLEPKERVKISFKKPRLKTRWALITALSSLLVLLASFLIFQSLKEKPSTAKTFLPESFQILRFEIQAQPSAPIIYKPYGSNLIFIWAENQAPKMSP